MIPEQPDGLNTAPNADRAHLHRAASAHAATFGWRFLSDDDLARCRYAYELTLALLDDDETDPVVRESTREYLALHVATAEAEERRRERAARLGVPRDTARFSQEWLADLKARCDLSTLLEYELGAQLGKAHSNGVRRGPCPFCRPSESSTCFVLHISDPTDEWYFCHRCFAAGDAFDAMMRAYGDPFPAAVARLAHLLGIPLPISAPPSSATRKRFNGRTKEVGHGRI